MSELQAGSASPSCATSVEGYDDRFMQLALAEARAALAASEVPVGCVFVDRSGAVVARGHNRTNERKNALEHAELVALAERDASMLDMAAEMASGERDDAAAAARDDAILSLADVTLYVTVEPCLMCGAALLYRRVRRVFYGCANPHFGGNGSVLSLHDDGAMQPDGRRYPSEGGHRAAEAVALLQDFYKQENPSAPEDKRCRKELS